MRLTPPLRRSLSKLGEMNKLRRYSLALGATRVEMSDYEIMNCDFQARAFEIYFVNSRSTLNGHKMHTGKLKRLGKQVS